MRIIVIFSMLLLLPSFVLSASLYKWRDASGSLHITDTVPPPSAQDVSGGTYIQKKQSALAHQQAENQNFYYDQLSQRNYLETERQRVVSEYNDRLDDRQDLRYEQRQAYLQAQIDRYSRSININDPKTTRDYHRQQRDYYKEQLRILKKHH